MSLTITTKIGDDGKLYRNTGTVSVPVWNEIEHVKDDNRNRSRGEVDTASRATAGVATVAKGLLTEEISFANIYDDNDDDWDYFESAVEDMHEAALYAFMLDPITDPTPRGTVHAMSVFQCNTTRSQTESWKQDISLKPVKNDDDFPMSYADFVAL